MRGWRIPVHIIVWAFLYLLPYAVGYDGTESLAGFFSNRGDRIHLLSTVFLVLFAYGNYFFLVPKLFSHHRYVVFFITLVAGFLFVIWLPGFILGGPGPHHGPPPGFDGRGPVDHGHGQPLFVGKTYNSILFLVITFVSISVQTYLQVLKLQQAKTSAELSFLKAQINPHFLFNSLNGIYALSLQGSERTPGAILQLSALMRYLLVDARDEDVPLEKELSYIDSYIELQRMRLGDTVELHYTKTGSAEKLRIAPLLLIPFIENAFKYGVNPDVASFVHIDLAVRDQMLLLDVRNPKVAMGAASESSGIGLVNARARLQHQYENRHILAVNDGPEIYTVHLTLQL
jgi:hypothetical protein